MPKKWKPTCPWIKKEQAQAKRALGAWHPVNNGQEPAFRYAGKVRALARNVYLYAAAIGQKRGLLPAELGAWSCWGWAPGMKAAAIYFGEPGKPGMPIVVQIGNLEAWPAPPAEETIEEAAWQIAA